MSTPPIAYNVAGAARAVGLSPAAIRKAIHTGQLRAKSTSVDERGAPRGVYLIRHADLEAWVEAKTDA